MTRLDPYALSNAISQGRQDANRTVGVQLAIEESQRRARRDELIQQLELEEHQVRMAEERQQAAERAATQQFNSNLYGAFNPVPAPPVTTGTEADFFAPTDAQYQQQVQQQTLFTQLPPQVQQLHLAPLMKEAEIRRRRDNVQTWLQQRFPTRPDVIQDSMDDWDMRNLHGFDDQTLLEIRNNRPINIARYRDFLTGLVGNPQGPVPYAPGMGPNGPADGGFLSPEMRDRALSVYAMTGQRPSNAQVSGWYTAGDRLDAQQTLAHERYNQQNLNREDQQAFQIGQQEDRQNFASSQLDDRQTFAERQRMASNSEYDRRMRERAALRQMAPTSDANYIRLKGQVDAWQREIENQKTLGNKNGVRDAMAGLYTAEEELDNYLRGAAGRAKQMPSPQGLGAPSGAPASSSPAATTAQMTMREALMQAANELAPNATQAQIQQMRERIKARAQQIMSGG